MDWSNERWCRVYTRDTTTWKLVDWKAHTVLLHLFRKVDRAGVLDVGDDGVLGLAAVLELPVDIVEDGIRQLTACRKPGGSPTVIETPSAYVIPNFIEAQEAPQSDSHRKKEERARRRDKAVAEGILDEVSRNRTRPSESVRDRHVVSQPVTPIRSEPNQSNPILTEPTRSHGSASDARDRAIPPVRYLSQDIEQILQTSKTTQEIVVPSEVIRAVGYDVNRCAMRTPIRETVKPVTVERSSEFVRSTAELFAELPDLAELVKPDPEPSEAVGSLESNRDESPPRDEGQASKVQHGASQTANQTGLSGRRHPSGAAKQLAHELLTLIARNHPASKVATGTERLREDTRLRWGLTLDKINNIGLMTWEQIRVVMAWSQRDDFWKTRILGADHLWDCWDQIIADKTNKRRGAAKANPTESALREFEQLRAEEQRKAGAG